MHYTSGISLAYHHIRVLEEKKRQEVRAALDKALELSRKFEEDKHRLEWRRLYSVACGMDTFTE